jgi:diadenosine tetraphosphate (Ap4A) HIT family hydrolase
MMAGDLLIHVQVHFHLIPKPNALEGLGIEWPAQKTDMDKLKQLYTQIQAKM